MRTIISDEMPEKGQFAAVWNFADKTFGLTMKWKGDELLYCVNDDDWQPVDFDADNDVSYIKIK